MNYCNACNILHRARLADATKAASGSSLAHHDASTDTAGDFIITDEFEFDDVREPDEREIMRDGTDELIPRSHIE